MLIRPITIEELKEKKVYIFGAGSYGSIIFKILKRYQIEIICFIDSNASYLENFGVKVISPDLLKNETNQIVLLASLNHLNEMINILENKNIKEYYSIATILEEMSNLKELNEYELEIGSKIERYTEKIKALENGKLALSNVDLVVTEFCNLRCKGCGSLMPLYQEQQHIPLDNIIETFDRFLETIDFLLELRVLGGEPFLYPDLCELIERYSQSDKIKKIIIFTNSTIVPNNSFFDLLDNKKVFIHMSDYGMLSNALESLKEVCDKYRIEYHVHKYQEWRDMGEMKCRNYTINEQKEIFRSCENKNCYCFYRGKLFICPRAAHGERLGYFVNKENEIIDFSSDMYDKSQKRKEFLDWFNNMLYTACNYCDGNNIHKATIPAAVQIKRN